ncbi:natural killer cell receptor 2B4-like isoform X2 [Onychostoma macrolepis]|uniref:natural killer cell receptor 2B4-like isoform X2 n=1 Tax=Onychostoma macrolepis TaxID=369639 RepID=UPI00272B79B2|nr:natural killer cell receptor 2B4-like isoform X2 [Onychostoma macrolepis]
MMLLPTLEFEESSVKAEELNMQRQLNWGDSVFRSDTEEQWKMVCTFVSCYLFWWRLTGVFGSETNELQSLSVEEGDSVTLNTTITEIPEDDDILWKFGAENSLIAQINRADGIINTCNDGRFRDRLKLDNQTGSLTITNTTTEHAGLYKLRINGAERSSKTFSVSVYARLPVPVISSNSSHCSSSYCSLLCSAVNVSHVTLSWYKGNSLLSSISVSDLSISLSLPLEVEYQDNNTYSCVLNNPISKQTTHLDISQLCHTCAAGPQTHSHSPENSVSLIVLISAAAGSLLIVAAVRIFCIRRKHRKTEQEVQTQAEESAYAEPTFYKRKGHKWEVKEDHIEEDHVAYASVAVKL